MTLFQRYWRVRLDDFQFTGLNVSFDIEKSTKREPNKASLTVYNLAQAHRRQLEGLSRAKGPGKIRLELEAGYIGGQSGLIFRGDLRTAKSVQEGSDWTTVLEGEDGGRAVLYARVNRSFPPGTRVETVIQACAQAMGVGLGNLAELSKGAKMKGSGAAFPEGTVLSGSAPDELDRILRSVGLRYSVQNGVLQVLVRGQALQTTAVRLASSTGLIGVPEVNADGTVTATTLLIPDIYPGRRVQFDTQALKGTYRVERAKYQGDSAGDTWYIHIETQPVGKG